MIVPIPEGLVFCAHLCINIKWEVEGGCVTTGVIEVVVVRGGSRSPSHRPSRLRRPLRSQRWTLSFGGEEEVAAMTATAMSSRWLQREQAVDGAMRGAGGGGGGNDDGGGNVFSRRQVVGHSRQ